MIFSHVVHWVSSVAQATQDIDKRFSASLKGVENKESPVKNLASKIFIPILCQMRHFCQIFFKKLMFCHLYLCPASMLSMIHLFIFDNVIRITPKELSIRIFLTIGILNDKNRLSEGDPRFLSILPFINLQIKSIV